jgi:hypothetical protein
MESYPLYYDTGFRVIYKFSFDFVFLLCSSHDGSQQCGGASAAHRPAACIKGGIFVIGMSDYQLLKWTML